METFIALLRGINVGGRNKILMPALKKCLLGLGFNRVETYIQSGNIIFQTTQNQDISSLKTKIEQAIAKEFNLQIEVFILSSEELLAVKNATPWINLGAEQSAYFHFSFLEKNPTDSQTALAGDFRPDEWFWGEKVIYIYCPNGYGKTKLHNTFIEKKLKLFATTRNFNTVEKLLSLCQEMI